MYRNKTKQKTVPSLSRSHHELQSVMAELLWRSGGVVTVVPSDVGINAAALAPPLVAVSSQTGETNNEAFKWWGLTSLTFAAFQLCLSNVLMIIWWYFGLFIYWFLIIIITWLECSEAWRSTPGHRRYHNAAGCRRSKTWRRRRDQEAQSHSVGPAHNKHEMSQCFFRTALLRCRYLWSSVQFQHRARLNVV